MRVRFYLIKNNKNSISGQVRVSFSWKGNRVQITTGESVRSQYWNSGAKENYILKGQDWYVHINKRLSDIKKWAGDIYYQYQNDTKQLDKDIFIQKYRKEFLSEKPPIIEEKTATTILDILKKALDFKKKVTRYRSYKSYQSTYNHFEKFINKNGYNHRLKFDKYICTEFENYLVEKFSSNATINNNTQYFTTLLNQAVRMHLVEENPYKRTELTTEETINQSYSDDQAKQILDHLDKKDLNLKRFCQFIFYSFARPIELRRLKVGDIDFIQEVLFVSARGKNRANRPVEILNPFMKLIEEMELRKYPDDYFIFTSKGIPGPRPIHKNVFNYNFRERLIQLGFDSKYTMYSFKHYGVIKHFLAGFDLRWLQDQTGHQDISTLMKYLRSLGLKINRAGNLKAPEV